VAQSLNFVKSNLNNLGVEHDSFVNETDIINKNEVEKVVELLKNKNFVYEGKIEAPKSENNSDWVERNQLLFKSSGFGDDKDRALQKSDKSWTYFAGDVAYHNNKLIRKFDTLINILGADHAGYVKRITAVVEALSGNKNKIKCKVSQLVKLIKDGKPFKMSKRKGDYITVEDLLKEVGKDATRFIMLNRSSDVELDFDFTKVKEKSKDNPLYYVQYCYARICSVFRHVNVNINDKINVKNFNFIKGFEGGKLEYESVVSKEVSNSNLIITDFKVSKVPALAQLLTLASLQGIADTLSGEGIRFETFEMKSNSKGNILNIEESIALGPAVSILFEGYVDKGKIVSLNGTLVPARTVNKVIGWIPVVGKILVGNKIGEGVFGVSFKMKGPPKNIKTTVNPIKTLTPRFITRMLEKMKDMKNKNEETK